MAKKSKRVVIEESDVQEVSAKLESDLATEVDAVKAAAIAKRAATNAAKKEAKTKLLGFLKENEDFEFAAELKLLIATAARESKPRSESINETLKQALIEAGDEGLSEMDIFKKFKIGQPEMSIKTRLFVKVKDPKDRIWIEFFEDEGLYKVVATGADMPEDWDGYIPADQVAL